jgi:hypothetical protein
VRLPDGQLWHVDAPHFSAGVIVRDGKIILAAPILAYSRGWSIDRFCDYCRRKGWRYAAGFRLEA